MKETGTSMNGHIINTNKVKAIKCNCSNCGWSHKTRYKDIYCDYFKKNNPQKDKCKRYYKRGTL